MPQEKSGPHDLGALMEKAVQKDPKNIHTFMDASVSQNNAYLIHSFREQFNVSAEDLASSLDITPEELQEIESGLVPDTKKYLTDKDFVVKAINACIRP